MTQHGTPVGFPRQGLETRMQRVRVKELFAGRSDSVGPEKIREWGRRGEAWGTSEARQMSEHGIGRGGIYLRCT